MTFSIRTIVAATALAFTALTASARAQSTKIKAEIPFMFDYNGHTFASGTYDMTVRADGVVEMGRSRHVQTALAQPTTGEVATISSLSFDRSGNKYFLRKISIAGSDQRLSFLETKSEKRLATEFNVAADESSHTVEVVGEGTR